MGWYWATTALAGLVAVAAQYTNPCSSAPYNAQPWCDVTLDYPSRVADLLGRIPVADKIGMFNTASGGSNSLGIASYQWWSEALHGVAGSPGVSFRGATPYATSFPQVITTAASFNTTLYQTVGAAISTEARVMNNQNNAGLTFWTPNINVFRDPRWGRGHETPGEDPYLSAQYAKHFVRGFQWGEDPRYLKASSCCKHYTAYDLENWNGTDRHHFNAVVTDQDLVDTFQVPFQACVQQAQVSSIMCSYNEVNGIPSCANDFLMTEVLRNEWGFQGYITSDCGAVSDIINNHKYTNTTDETCAVTLQSGMDIGCDGFLPANLQKALNDNAVSVADLDRALTNLFLVRFRLGQFDSVPQPYLAYNLSQWCTPEHQDLSVSAARQGITLLKNTGALPLSKSGIKSLAVIGPNANATKTMQANYEGPPCFNLFVSPLQGLGNYATTTYVEGTGISNGDQSQFPQAVAAAQAADATIVVVGLDMSQEAEGHDRTIISLPGAQLALIQAVCGAAKGPCIVVSMNGGGVDLSWARDSSQVAGIVWVGYPGPYGGQALAETLFGDNVPAGRLPVTYYPTNYTDEVSMFDMNMRPGPSAWPPGTNPGRTHRFYTGQPAFPFGFGLSYTTFTYAVAAAPPSTVSMEATNRYLSAYVRHNARYAPLDSEIVGDYTVNVTNTGSIDADDVVLGFTVPPGAGTNGIPLQELFGFARVHVPAGQTVQVTLGLGARHLAQVNQQGDRVAWPGVYAVRFGVAGSTAIAEHSFVAAE